LGEDGVEGLPTNSFIEDLVNSTSKNLDANNIQCDLCEEEKTASKFCVEEAQYLCEACVKIHKRGKSTKAHKLEELENVFGKEKQAVGSAFCHLHPAEKLTEYCQTCSQVICPKCLLQDHRLHTWANFNDLISPKMEELSLSMTKARHFI